MKKKLRKPMNKKIGGLDFYVSDAGDLKIENFSSDFIDKPKHARQAAKELIKWADWQESKDNK